MPNSSDPISVEEKEDLPDRRTLIKDVIIFQGKLALDGLRDLLLSPVSIIFALLDLAFGGEKAGQRFYRLLYFGHRTDRWINLFGAASRINPPAHMSADEYNVDKFVNQLEEVLRQHRKDGNVTASAKASINDTFAAFLKTLRAKPQDDTHRAHFEEKNGS